MTDTDGRASFEARAVLAPRRARLSRLALLLPVVALVATAWAGVSGARPDPVTTEIADASAFAAAQQSPAQYPAQVLGLDVQELNDVRGRMLGRDEVVVVVGWYVATAITDCPPLAAIYREASLPEIRDDVDEWAFCNRSGVLYASRPDDNAGPSAVAVKLQIGVLVPKELEIIGADATQVVVVGRFVESGDGCRVRAGCRRELVVDHVAWTPGA
jgi:hypothetical protein